MKLAARNPTTQTIYAVGLGIFLGLGGHYLEHGWNAGVTLLSKVYFFVMLAFSLVITVLGLVADEPSPASQPEEER